MLDSRAGEYNLDKKVDHVVQARTAVRRRVLHLMLCRQEMGVHRDADVLDLYQ